MQPFDLERFKAGEPAIDKETHEEYFYLADLPDGGIVLRFKYSSDSTYTVWKAGDFSLQFMNDKFYMKEKEMINKPNSALQKTDVSDLLRFSGQDVDFAYLCGVFNVSGIDGLHKEIQRLKAIGKEPHDIIDACRKQ